MATLMNKNKTVLTTLRNWDIYNHNNKIKKKILRNLCYLGVFLEIIYKCNVDLLETINLRQYF